MNIRWRQIAQKSTKSKEAGISLIMVMLAVLVLAVLTATMVFVANSETLASYNYKLDTQADYLAKAGIQAATNWLRSNRYQALSQIQAATDYNVLLNDSILQLYTSNSQPVQCISGCPSLNSPVQLIGYGSGSSNYPNINNSDTPSVPVATAFAQGLVNHRVTGDPNNSGTFSVNMTLLNYQTVNTTNALCVIVGILTPPCPVETWLVSSKGTWTRQQGSTSVVAQAEEQAVVQPIYTPAFNNALYGYCGVYMHGNSGVCTDSFNSALGQYGGGSNATAAGRCDSNSTNVIDAGAGVGGNGGVTLGNNVIVSGNVTIGNGPTLPCSYNGFSGNTGSVLGQVVNGPHKNPPAVPTFRSGFPSGAPSYNHTSAVVPSGATWPLPLSFNNFPSGTGLRPPLIYSSPCMDLTCNGTAAHPYEISSISLRSSDKLQFIGGTDFLHPVYYDIDSIDEAGNAEIDVSGYVALNVQTRMSITGNGVTNGVAGVTDIPPECVQINFAGTGTVSLGGNGAISAIITAPNATVSLGGGGSAGYFVGSIQADQIDDGGGYPVHYDLQLNRLGGTLGTIATTAYSRKKM